MNESGLYHAFRRGKEGRWFGGKNKATYFKTSFSFCLKTSENMETPEKEELRTCQSRKIAEFSEYYIISF